MAGEVPSTEYEVIRQSCRELHDLETGNNVLVRAWMVRYVRGGLTHPTFAVSCAMGCVQLRDFQWACPAEVLGRLPRQTGGKEVLPKKGILKNESKSGP